MPRICTVATVLDPELGAVRLMTTHLEYYSARQRMAQARALRALHAEACALAEGPPLADDADASPFRPKRHTRSAVLCGDFNLPPAAPEYAEIQAADRGARLHDAWPLAHGAAPHAPTFRVFDRTYGPVPLACDFVFVSDDLVPRVRTVRVDGRTQDSDHQPVLVELGGAALA